MRRLSIAALVLASVARAAGPPTVVFLSDFGTRDDAVAICKGVMLQVEPALRVIDLTHEVTPFAKPVRLDIRSAQLDGDRIRGTVIATDGPYGNLLTDVDAALFQKLGWAIGDTVPVEIAGATLDLPYARTFGDVPEGTALL